MNQMIKLCKLWIPVLVWAGIIFYFSSRPRIASGLEEMEVGLVDLFIRKLVHITEYLVLTLLCHRAIKGSFKIKSFQLLAYSIMFALIYAGLDEYHQKFVPSRTCSIFDVLVDSMGIVLAYVFLRWKSKAPKG